MTEWYDNDDLDSTSLPSSAEEGVMEAVTLSPDNIRKLAKQMNLDLGRDDEGDYMVVTGDMVNNPNFNSQFIDYWVGASGDKQSVEQKRKVRNSAYANMDVILGEAIITLDAYADEALGVGFIEQPIDITFSDNAIGEQVLKILKRNDIIGRSRGHIRNLCKWGDIGAHLVMPAKGNDPLDIKIKMRTPDDWEAFFTEKGPVPLGYHLNPQYGKTKRIKKSDLIQPWEFIQFSVPDDEFAPYGRSLLEAMRTSFDQLVTIEALLALSRASRVERLVVRVPTGQTNPTAAMSKLNDLKARWKNTIFNDKTGKSSQARTPSLMDVMFIPSDEGFSVDRLASGSGVEISSTEDVEYFRNQVLMMSGLPKGYLLADESTDRYHSLAAQDLKFARKLIPYQDAYAAGLTRLCMVLGGYLGADLESFEVTVKIKRPVQISDQLLQNYEAVSRASVEMIDNYKRANMTVDEEGNESSPTLDPDTYAKLMAELGMPEDIIKLFDQDPNNDPKFPDNSPDDDKTTTAKSHLIDGKGRFTQYYTKLKERISIICHSKDVLEESRELFAFFAKVAPSGSTILLEALDGSAKPVIKC